MIGKKQWRDSVYFPSEMGNGWQGNMLAAGNSYDCFRIREKRVIILESDDAIDK